jgi:hypothetical protein
MTKGTLRLVLVALFGVAMGAGLVTYADDDDDKPKGYDANNDPKMAAMMKYSMPGPEHGVLQQLKGKWEQQVKWRMGADKPWVTSNSKCKNKLVLDGRYIQQTIESEKVDDFKYQAIAYIGYDNYKKKYVATWIDNMSTMIGAGEGTYEPTSNTFTFHGTFPDFETGRIKSYRSVMTIHHKDAMTEQVYEPDDEGNEFMSVETHYKRD